MKEKKAQPQDPMKRLQKIFRERSSTAVQAAKKEILSEKIESPEVCQALTYFMTKYWHDTTRPALLSMFCEAVGGKTEIPVPIAVSAILISGAVDIHDDIIDESKTKESYATVFGKYGKDIALLTADALIFKGLTTLFRAIKKGVSPEKLLAIIGSTEKTFFELGDAEALELRFRRKIDITPQEYLQVLKKKAAIVEGYAQIGAMLGNGSKTEIKKLGKYGRILGMLIMLRDDLIDIIDVEEARNRMQKESLPLPIIYALKNPESKSIIEPYLRKKTITRKDAQLIIKTANEAGGTECCKKLMKKLSKEAYTAIKQTKYNKANFKLLIRAVVSL